MRLKEGELRKVIRSWPEYDAGMITFIEPGKGSDIGVADCLLTMDGRLVPLELKRGKSVVAELRPSQRAWHRDQLANRVQTYGLAIGFDGRVSLVSIHLTGGRSSDLIEIVLKSWESTQDVSFAQLIDVIRAQSNRSL